MYRIEGELTNLSEPTIYIAYETQESYVFDTIQANTNGHFSVMHEVIDDLQSVTVFYQNKDKWFTVYPEAGKTVQIKGDAQYSELIQVKGGRTNDKLNGFRNRIAPLLKKQADMENDEIQRMAREFIEKNPKEEASAILVAEYFGDPENTLQTEGLLETLSPTLNDFYVVKDLKRQADKAKTSMVGAKAPEYNVVNIYGKTFTPDSFLNKYYILAFTALWCDLCQTEMMMLDRISSEHAEDSLAIMMISLDDSRDDVFKLLAGDSIRWNLVIDSAGQAIDMFGKYNVNSLPRCLLMDREGVIRLRTSNGAELKQTVDEIFK